MLLLYSKKAIPENNKSIFEITKKSLSFKIQKKIIWLWKIIIKNLAMKITDCFLFQEYESTVFDLSSYYFIKKNNGDIMYTAPKKWV
jgi:hypothetical protein